MTRKGPDQLLEEELTGKIIGAFYECYNELGYGFLEAVYRRALVAELCARGHRCEVEGLVEVAYKGVAVGTYRFDLLVDERVMVETKAGEVPGPTDKRQLLNYLCASRIEVGLLLHCGPEPRFLRCVHQKLVGPD
jgi:GxxExxY protein